MKTKTLTCGIRIDDNRSINCGVSIVNQSNPMFILSYSSIDGFGFYSRSTHSMYMHNVNQYLTALSDIITAIAEANKFVDSERK